MVAINFIIKQYVVIFEKAKVERQLRKNNPWSGEYISSNNILKEIITFIDQHLWELMDALNQLIDL